MEKLIIRRKKEAMKMNNFTYYLESILSYCSPIISLKRLKKYPNNDSIICTRVYPINPF
jgi:hypothetical protein